MKKTALQKIGQRYPTARPVRMGLSDAPRRFRWTREEYYALGETGIFDGQRIELIEGEIFEMAPQNSPHAEAVTLIAEALRHVFGLGYRIRTQVPLSLGTDSDPEPDIAVVEGIPHGFRDAHPTTALLVVEVSDSTLGFDQGRKAAVYAAAGIADYWILNLKARQLELYRRPLPSKTRRGFVYEERTLITADGAIAPLAAPDESIAVADLLP